MTVRRAIVVCASVLAFVAALPSCKSAGLGRCIITPDAATNGRELYVYPAAANRISLACKYSTGSNNITMSAKLNAPSADAPFIVDNGTLPTTGYEAQIDVHAPRATQADMIFTISRAVDPDAGTLEFAIGNYRWDVFIDDGSGEQLEGSYAFTVFK